MTSKKYPILCAVLALDSWNFHYVQQGQKAHYVQDHTIFFIQLKM